MLQISRCQRLDEAWLFVPHIAVGDVPSSLGTPDLYVTVEADGDPLRCLAVYGGRTRNECFAFEEAFCWGNWLVIGFGERVHLVSMTDERAVSIDLREYFASFHPVSDQCLLVATAGSLLRMDETGTVVWRNDRLGLDGVVVGQVTSELVMGDGEWDPPNGWRPFTVDLATGELLA